MKFRTAGRSHKVVLEMEPRDDTFPPVNLPELKLKRILLPVDFSECSRKATTYAASLARQFNAEVLLLHVIEIAPHPPEMLILESETLNAKLRTETNRLLSEWRQEIPERISTRVLLRNGTAPYREIVQAAHENNADLIVLGTHGRTGLAHLLIGSTAERVVRHAPCPVLVVREREHDFVEPKSKTTLSEIKAGTKGERYGNRIKKK